jgi:hypothetical protein
MPSEANAQAANLLIQRTSGHIKIKVIAGDLVLPKESNPSVELGVSAAKLLPGRSALFVAGRSRATHCLHEVGCGRWTRERAKNVFTRDSGGLRGVLSKDCAIKWIVAIQMRPPLGRAAGEEERGKY